MRAGTLLVKADQQFGQWNFKLRMLHPNGSIMRDVTVVTRRWREPWSSAVRQFNDQSLRPGPRTSLDTRVRQAWVALIFARASVVQSTHVTQASRARGAPKQC